MVVKWHAAGGTPIRMPVYAGAVKGRPGVIGLEQRFQLEDWALVEQLLSLSEGCFRAACLVPGLHGSLYAQHVTHHICLYALICHLLL